MESYTGRTYPTPGSACSAVCTSPEIFVAQSVTGTLTTFTLHAGQFCSNVARIDAIMPLEGGTSSAVSSTAFASPPESAIAQFAMRAAASSNGAVTWAVTRSAACGLNVSPVCRVWVTTTGIPAAFARCSAGTMRSTLMPCARTMTSARRLMAWSMPALCSVGVPWLVYSTHVAP